MILLQRIVHNDKSLHIGVEYSPTKASYDVLYIDLVGKDAITISILELLENKMPKVIESIVKSINWTEAYLEAKEIERQKKEAERNANK